MANAIKLNLPPADSLFSTQEERDDAKLERVMNLRLTETSDFPNHPFNTTIEYLKLYRARCECDIRA